MYDRCVLCMYLYLVRSGCNKDQQREEEREREKEENLLHWTSVGTYVFTYFTYLFSRIYHMEIGIRNLNEIIDL